MKDLFPALQSQGKGLAHETNRVLGLCLHPKTATKFHAMNASPTYPSAEGAGGFAEDKDVSGPYLLLDLRSEVRHSSLALWSDWGRTRA